MTDTGWVPPGNGFETDVGDRNWSDEGDITAEDASGAQITLFKNDLTNYLRGNTFDFSAIPDTDEILGVEFKFVRRSNAAVSGHNVHDLSLQLTPGGTIGGNNLADTGTKWPETFTESATYGSPTSHWGHALTAAVVKASNFGFALRAEETMNNAFTAPAVDVAYLKVYHQPPSTATGFFAMFRGRLRSAWEWRNGLLVRAPGAILPAA